VFDFALLDGINRRDMALLAEEIVEEWLNRKGYFTIRGIKMGVHEIDLVAVKRTPNGEVECRHIEVQASMRPVSYISRVPKELQKTGRAANSAKRSESELRVGVKEWIEKKFRMPGKLKLMKTLWGGSWSEELVLHVVKSEDEVELIKNHGINILRLRDIIQSLAEEHFPLVNAAAGADLVDLMQTSVNSSSSGGGTITKSSPKKHRSAAAGS
jgi:hypothetical protein